MGMRLSRFLAGAKPAPLVEVPASIPLEEFRDRFVRRNQPCVIRGFGVDWPVCHWSFAELQESFSGIPVFAGEQETHDRPIEQYTPKSLTETIDSPRKGALSSEEFFQRMDASSELTGAIYHHKPGFERFRAALGSVSRLVAGPKSRLYKDRCFVYKGGFTGWHFHFGDESLSLQAIGSKEVHVLPPHPEIFGPIMAAASRGLVVDADLEAHRDVILKHFRGATLHPGDLVYLPVYWWHAFEPPQGDRGLTLAHTFASPREIQFDLRIPEARWVVRTIASRPKMWPVAAAYLGGTAMALLRHPIRPAYLHRS